MKSEVDFELSSIAVEQKPSSYGTFYERVKEEMSSELFTRAKTKDAKCYTSEYMDEISQNGANLLQIRKIETAVLNDIRKSLFSKRSK